ncbi:hypothetical protein HHK36_007950 [Tetracentron sinense]|uniref:RING-type domain-containing protein n=1 Tax=Tetracentron sinense TaxID=13715 RepID=A0A835DMS5_TETSI|nr:hypothetical protein HHK36_007950 [Tetracentron sinense]
MLQNFLGNAHARRLLLHTPLYQSADTAAPRVNDHDSSEIIIGERSFDTNIVMIISVILCALICALVLNSIIRCLIRCSTRVGTESESGTNLTKIANTRLKREALKNFPTLTYYSGSKVPCLDTECVICLSEFAPGERIRILPKCNHGFHVQCIDKWLTAHFSCPTCRNCLLKTCQKITGSDRVSSSEPPPLLLPERTVPLEPEDLEPNYWSNC